MEDFISRKWTIEKSFFDKEIMGYDQKTKKEIPWPLIKQEITDYKVWLYKVTDPVTKRFYKSFDTIPEYDSEGKEIPGSGKNIETEAHFTRKQIVRVRTPDGKSGFIHAAFYNGYDSLGGEVTQKFQESEKWDQDSLNMNDNTTQRPAV